MTNDYDNNIRFISRKCAKFGAKKFAFAFIL